MRQVAAKYFKIISMSVRQLDKLGGGGFGISFSKRSTIFSRIVDVKDRLRHSKLNVAMKLYIVTWREKEKKRGGRGEKINFVNDKIRR